MINSLWHLSSRESKILSKPSDDILHSFKTVCSMISTGTESLVANGLVGKKFEEHMSVPNMEGSFDFPIKYGYSSIIQKENGILGHIMHPHQDKIQASMDSVYWIEEQIPAERFALISNMETIINAIWDSNPNRNDKIAICGFGNIGSLLANTLRVHYDLEVDVIEVDEWRVGKAKDLGWNISEGEMYDIIYHTTSSATGLQYCIDHLNFEGKVIELSWYGDKKINLSLGHEFHYKRLQIISSQVSVIPGHMKEETYQSRKDLALRFLNHGSYDNLITSKIPFRETPKFYLDLRNNNQPKGLIYIIQY